MKGWRDTKEDSEEFKIFRQIFLFGSCVQFANRTDVIRGRSKEEERRRGKWKKKNSSPSLFVIRRLNPICDSPVTVGDRIELSR